MIFSNSYVGSFKNEVYFYFTITIKLLMRDLLKKYEYYFVYSYSKEKAIKVFKTARLLRNLVKCF